MKLQSKWIAGMLAGILAPACGAAYAEGEGYVTLGVGYESSSGKYGTASTTDIVMIPVSVMYETGPWALKLTVPYLKVTGEGDVIASGGYRGGGGGWRASSTTTTKTRTTQSGLGDVATLLTWNLYSGAEFDSGVELGGRIKFGTASTALGTGQNDYAVYLYAFRDIGNFTPNVLIGYEMLGSSAQLALDNVYYGALGSSYAFGERTSAGLEYKYAQKASPLAAEQRQLTFYGSVEIVTDVYLRGYLLKGYADGSPDTGYGVTISSVF